MANVKPIGINQDTGCQVVVGDGDTMEFPPFIFNQGTPSATWNIAHNLNRFPSVVIVDSGGDQVIGDVNYVDANNITVTFSSAFSGIAYL